MNNEVTGNMIKFGLVDISFLRQRMQCVIIEKRNKNKMYFIPNNIPSEAILPTIIRGIRILLNSSSIMAVSALLWPS